MAINDFVPLLLFSISTTFTPGPNNLMIMNSGYMLYLAYQILISSSKANLGKTRKPLSFLQAAMFQWVNPKAWLMAIGTISIFTISNHYFNNAFIISVVYFLICIPCIGAWLVFGKFLQRILKKDHHRLWLNTLMALALIGSIGMILFD